MAKLGKKKRRSVQKRISEKREKLRLGWFSFSCGEDNTIVMTEVMNEHWREWRDIFDFRHVRALRSKNVLDHLEIAFVEGAIASEAQAKKLREIRKKSRVLVAVGACALAAMPAGQRNTFDEARQKEIDYLIARFAALPKVLTVPEVVKVDAQVPGCPMDPDVFLKVVNNLVTELKRGPRKSF